MSFKTLQDPGNRPETLILNPKVKISQMAGPNDLKFVMSEEKNPSTNIF